MSLSRQFQRLSQPNSQYLNRAYASRPASSGVSRLVALQHGSDFDDLDGADGQLISDQIATIVADGADIALQNRMKEAKQADELEAQRELEREEDDDDNDVPEPVNGDNPDVNGVVSNSKSSSARTSTARHFFEEIRGDENQVRRYRCLLAPEPAENNNSQSHKTNIAFSGNWSNMWRHLNGRVRNNKIVPSYHMKAMAFFKKMTEDDGIAPNVAAARTIQWSHEQAESRGKRVHAQGQSNDDTRLQQELLLMSHYAVKGISFNSVECEHLRAYHQVRNWELPPNRKRLAGPLLDKCYELSLTYLSEAFAEADYFSLITDAWTSDAMHKFVAVNISFVDKSYRLHVLCLAIIPLQESHTWWQVTHEIATRVQNALPKDAVLVATITDNGANFLKVARALHTNLEKAAIELEFGHVNDSGIDMWNAPIEDNVDITAQWRCVAHKAQLAVNDVIGINSNSAIGASRLLRKVHALTVFVRASPARREALLRAQRTLEMKPLAPVMDVATRWLATFYMLKRFILNYDAYVLMAQRKQLDDFCGASGFVTPLEKRTLIAIRDALEPVEKFVRLCEGEQYVTLAITPVLLAEMLHSLRDRSNNDDGNAYSTVAKNFRRELRRAIEDRLGYILDSVNMSLCAAALHPDYGHLRFVEDESVRDGVWEELKNWLVGPNSFPVITEAEHAEDASSFRLPTRPPTSERIKEELDFVRRQFESRVDDRNRFRVSNGVNGGTALDPLKWWQEESSRSGSAVSAIAVLPRIVFCVMATSAASEREFSSVKQNTLAVRPRLAPVKSEKVAVMRSLIRDMGAEKWRLWIAQELAKDREWMSKNKRRKTGTLQDFVVSSSS